MTQEQKDQINAWIAERLHEGKTLEEIKRKMAAEGYSEEVIASLFEEKKAEAPKPAPAEGKQPFGLSRKTMLWIAIGISLLVILSIAYLVISPTIVKACDTKECFIAAASKCKSADWISKEEVGTFYFSSEGCVLKKTLIAPDENETQAMKDLLAMNEMVCAYTKGNFDEQWVNSLTQGIEKCEGDLVRNIATLALFA